MSLSPSQSSPECSPDKSWRMTIHSSCRKSSHHYLRSASQELLQRSLESIEHSSHKKSNDTASDYESCNSSLRSLNFDSDSEKKNYTKKNTKATPSSLSARKKLHFERMTNVEDGSSLLSPRSKNKKTPTSYMKTPVESAPCDISTPPKRISHNHRPLLPKQSKISPENDKIVNLTDLVDESNHKHSRSDLPKVRMSLFNDSPNKVIPVKAFYSKIQKTVTAKESLAKFDKIKIHKITRRHSCSHNNRPNRNRRLDINRGVHHGIRKPKMNKKSCLSKARALKLSMDLIDNSPLNDYIENFMKSGNNFMKESLVNSGLTFLDQSNVKKNLLNLQVDNEKEFVTESIVYSDNEDAYVSKNVEVKKFFKSSRNFNKKVTIELPSMKLQMKNGKLHLSKCKFRSLNDPAVIEQNFKHYATMYKDVTDLLNDEDDVSEKSTIDTLLSQWSEEDVPKTEPQIALCTDEVHKNIQNAEQLLQIRQNSSPIFFCDDSTLHNDVKFFVDSEDNQSNSTDTAYISDTNSQQSARNCLLPIDQGYIVVEDVDISEIHEPVQLETEIQKVEENIKITNENNINPEVLLSPTTQMCSMTSDLVINSPTILNMESSMINQSKTSDTSNDKLYPVFKKMSDKIKRQIPENFATKTIANKKMKLSSIKDQYLIDAGQRKFGATQCIECGVIYQIGDAVDENDHQLHHTAMDILKFPGWKTERLCGRWKEGRVIVVAPGDPASHWQRINDLLERVVHPQLGYAASLKFNKLYKVYLYIEKKQIVGCLVAEVLQHANKLITDNNILCCSNEFYPVKCGISRIWTHKSHRRKRIASNLLNSMRLNFIYGHVLLCKELAFSSPTPAGQLLAEKYTGTSNFYVYMN